MIYYKTSVDSDTGKKLSQVYEGIQAFRIKGNEFKAKYGIDKTLRDTDYCCDISGVQFVDNIIPNNEDWIAINSNPGFYAVRAKAKSKTLVSDFKALKNLRIPMMRLNEIIGHNCFFGNPGYEFDKNGYHLISVMKSWDVNIPDDCERISDTEFEQLAAK